MFLTPYNRHHEISSFNPFQAMEEMERQFFGEIIHNCDPHVRILLCKRFQFNYITPVQPRRAGKTGFRDTIGAFVPDGLKRKRLSAILVTENVNDGRKEARCVPHRCADK